MRLGFIARIDEETFRFASETGFDGLEIMAGKWEGQGDDPTADAAHHAMELLTRFGLKALTVQWAEDYCALEDPVKRLREFVAFAEVLDTRILTVNAWIPAGASVDEQFGYYKKLWTEFAKVVEDAGVRLLIENCPHGGRNLGHSTASFRRMFELVPSEAIGIEFDPSHYVFQFMDYAAAIREFGARIQHAVHAKDTQIMKDRLDVVGLYGDQYLGERWWRFRMPGYGDVDWHAFFVALSDISYEGDVIIEHEDPTFGGQDGLRRGHKFLRNYVF